MTARGLLEVASWIAAIVGTAFGVYAWYSQDNTPRTHIIDNKPSDIDIQFLIGTWRDNKGGKETFRVTANAFELRYVPPAETPPANEKLDNDFHEIKIQTVIQANGEWFILRTNPDGKRIRYAKESNDRLNIDQTEYKKDIFYLVREDY